MLSLDEQAWLGDPRRQQDYDVHAQTQSIILLFCDGWPDVTVSRGNGWDLLAAQAMPVIEQVVGKSYGGGGTLLRAMMTRLAPGRRIARHKDGHPSFAIAHRIHIPLVTNDDVEFVVGSERVPPRAHFAFEINNLLLHHVSNNGSTDRIHFIFDYIPPA
ncbi:MAG TPA: aspartyl/asparaginyl beta-hydroxylase domain-containing protein [Steroidobacteraceae bacterium]|nr:aspartyl/asparaginyl beta-hydroxylase domain-containing protein [Steroidobacteraceae bacterium]